MSANGAHRQAVREHYIMIQLRDPFGVELESGSVLSQGIAIFDNGAHLVYGYEVLYFIGEFFGSISGVVRKGLCRITVLPAALVLERLGKIPVIEGAEGLNAGFQQCVDHAMIKIQTLRIGRARSIGKDSRPGDRKPEGLEAELLHEPNIFLVEMKEVVGNIAGGAIQGVTRSVRERVPDGEASASLMYSAFHLIGGCCRTPEETFGKAERGFVVILRGNRCAISC